MDNFMLSTPQIEDRKLCCETESLEITSYLTTVMSKSDGLT